MNVSFLTGQIVIVDQHMLCEIFLMSFETYLYISPLEFLLDMCQINNLTSLWSTGN